MVHRIQAGGSGWEARRGRETREKDEVPAKAVSSLSPCMVCALLLIFVFRHGISQAAFVDKITLTFKSSSNKG